MDPNDVSFESIEGTDEDQLDPFVANANEDAIFSGADPDDTSLTEDVDDEDAA